MNLDTITCADALAFARGLPAGSVDCVVTSPPYFGLRRYDEYAVVIDPSLPEEVRVAIENEMERRGIHARR